MIRLAPVNEKLRGRQVRLLSQASGAPAADCAAALAAADGNVSVALVMLLSGADAAAARAALEQSGGSARVAIARLREPGA